MPEPTIAAKEPSCVKLEAGKRYAWCTCGLSKGQPLCDGSHKGCGMAPLVFTAEEAKEAWMCQCKKTATPPFCDGTHKNLP
jgi:CDGSH iron-sulfur domain-containing protein 3